MQKMFNELFAAIKVTCRLYPNDSLLLVGYFNIPGIKWTYEEEEYGYLVPEPSERRYNIYESAALLAFQKCNLEQMNHVNNGRGVFLDRSTDYENTQITTIDEAEMFDKDTYHQRAVSVRLLGMGPSYHRNFKIRDNFQLSR